MDSRFRWNEGLASGHTLGSMKAFPGGAWPEASPWVLPPGVACLTSRMGAGWQLDPVKYQNCHREEPEVRGGLGP